MGDIIYIRGGQKVDLCIDCMESPSMEGCTICSKCDWQNKFTKQVYDKFENNKIFPLEAK